MKSPYQIVQLFGKFLVHAWQQMTVGAERDVDGGIIDISRKDVTR